MFAETNRLPFDLPIHPRTRREVAQILRTHPVDVVRIESSTMALAGKAGLETPPSHLIVCAGKPVLLVQRFDPSTALDTIRERGVTVIPGAPPLWLAFSHFDEAPSDSFAGVRLALTGAAATLPQVLASRVLGADGQPGANERLTVAHIGVGGMGSVHVRNMKLFRDKGMVNIAAVCDADEKRLAAAIKEVGPGVTPYRDYRYILERRDVDAVIIATPDHWHAVQCVHGCETGKHVYVEKPSSVTIAEGKAMIAAARRFKRVVQVGSQARSAKPAHDACQFIRNGMLGRVHTVKCWHTLNPVGGTEPDAEPPPSLDWVE